MVFYGLAYLGWLGFFDGKNFSTYQRIPFDSSSISDNDIQSITEDQKGNLWLATKNGINRFNRNQHTFTRFLEGTDPRGVFRNMGQIAYTDTEGKTWISFMNSNIILSYDHTCQGFEGHTAKGSIYSMNSWKNYLLLGTRDDVAFFDKTANSIVQSDSIIPGISRLNGLYVIDILVSKSGAIWFATLRGLFRYDPFSQDWLSIKQEDGLSHNYIYALAEDKAGGIWAGTLDGLNYVSAEGKVLGNYSPNPQDPFSLRGKTVISLLIDEAENLWVGTLRGGLSKARLNFSHRFNPYTNTFFGEKYLNIHVLSIAEGKENRLWIGTENGLFLLDKTHKKILKQYTSGQDPAHSLLGNSITAVYEDDYGKVYVASSHRGLNVIDLSSGEIQHYPYDPNTSNGPKSLVIRTIRESLVNQKRVIWLTGNNTFQGHDPENDMEMIHHYPPQKDYPYKVYSWDLIPLDSCTVFSAHNNGLLRTDFCGDSTEFWFKESGQIDQPEFPIISLLPVHKNEIWVGTYGAGLFWMDLSSGEIKNYTRNHGLANNYIYGILDDSQGHIWMSTNQGISSFHPEKNIFTNFDPTAGLQNVEFSSGSFLKAKDGEMFFGGVNGFTSFYPDSIEFQSSSYQPPVRITSFRVSGKEIQTDSAIYLVEKIELPGYKKQYLEIRFSALDFSQPEKNMYQYRLKGYDSDWTSPSPLGLAQYTQLEPGTYTFEVRGSNVDGIFSSRSQTLTITLVPLWHQTAWFRIGGSILLLSMIILGVYLRIQTLRRNERLRLNSRIARMKQEALAAQMDHHFTFNSLNSIQRYIMENKREEAIRFISKFGKLIRRVLDQAAKNYQTIEEEIDTLELYLKLEQHRTRNKFSYEFQVDESVDIYNTQIPTNLLQPFIENAIWHGIMPKEEDNGLIIIHFSTKADNLLCKIEDNGIGREKAAELKKVSKLRHQSKGMRIIEERIEALNFLDQRQIQFNIIDLYDQDRHALGTRVELWFEMGD
ncbi:MAG: two-component regulator propeller domain-containing protein [Bacteroidia bacterium]